MIALSKLIWKNFFQRAYEPFMAFVFPLIIFIILRFIVPFGVASDYAKTNYLIAGILLYVPLTLGVMVLPVQIMQFKSSVIIKRIGVTPINTRLLTLTFILNYIVLGILGVLVFISFASLIELATGNLAGSDPNIIDKTNDLTRLTRSSLADIFEQGKTYSKSDLEDLFGVISNDVFREKLQDLISQKHLNLGGLDFTNLPNIDSKGMTAGLNLGYVYGLGSGDNLSLPWNDVLKSSFLDTLYATGNEQQLNGTAFAGAIGAAMGANQNLGFSQEVIDSIVPTFSATGTLFDVANKIAHQNNLPTGVIRTKSFLINNEGIGYFMVFNLLGNIMSVLAGMMIASISKTLPIAQALSSLIYFPSMFLTGMYFPLPLDGIGGQVAWIAPWRSIAVLQHMSWFGSGSDFASLTDKSIIEDVSNAWFGLNPEELPVGKTSDTWIALGITSAFIGFCIAIISWKFRWKSIRS